MCFFFHSNTLQLFYMIHLIPGEFDINVFLTISTSHSMTDEDVNTRGRQLSLPAGPLAPECFLWFLCGTQAS